MQWDVLRHLHSRPDASLHTLSELTFQSDQSMGELARRMVGSGLLERVPGPGRAVRHRLTPQGQDAYERGSGIVDTVLEESLGVLTTQERAVLHDLLLRAAEHAKSNW
ncbi:MarR family winged helix-turn-helix transcriptional regulator [Streptomyces sp. NPDC093516]|uniref:MarR family winged helix-turn-helix transcriptional regulator n=1 Tax=Streptomyces sp. NPDC093516 TaxID=3155304 RepID=UPI003416CE7F